MFRRRRRGKITGLLLNGSACTYNRININRKKEGFSKKKESATGSSVLLRSSLGMKRWAGTRSFASSKMRSSAIKYRGIRYLK